MRNAGTLTSPPVQVQFVLTNGPSFTTQYPLGVVTLPGLAPNGAPLLQESFTVPPGIPAVSYRVGLIVDPSNAVFESNETNNRSASTGSTSILATPDLVAVSVTPPATGQAGGILQFQATIRNDGTASATAIQIDYFVSPLTAPQTSTILGTFGVSSLAAGLSQDLLANVSLIAGFPIGYYRGGIYIHPVSGEVLTGNNEKRADTLTAVVSSVTTTSASLSLAAGVNLIAMPVSSTTTLTAADLAQLPGVQWVARLIGNRRFQVFLPPLTSSFALAGSEGYLVGRGATPATTVQVSGPAWPSTQLLRPLVPGLNAVAYPRGVPAGETALG
ncbi:MAG: hypothetical protein HY303_12770, partial [Candidatus Wallbacteria bacterium]|nr:hypothetical protein [Candidatus Wallbacteria bacterium]